MEKVNDYVAKSIKIQRKINRKLGCIVVLLTAGLYFTCKKPKESKGA